MTAAPRIAIVIGKPPFPVDMLRAAECFPLDERDSAAIAASLSDDPPFARVVVKLRAARRQWDPDAWLRAGWMLFETRHGALARIRLRRRDLLEGGADSDDPAWSLLGTADERVVLARALYLDMGDGQTKLLWIAAEDGTSVSISGHHVSEIEPVEVSSAR